MELEWETVSTKTIESIATDGKDLYIRTRSKGILLYEDLAEEFEWLLSSYDVEEYYRDNIKGQYRFKTLEDSEYFDEDPDDWDEE